MRRGQRTVRALAAAVLMVAVIAAALIAGAGALSRRDAEALPPPGTVGLFTSLPILWQETGDLTQLLRSDSPPHWVRIALERTGTIQPLDTLADHAGRLPLAPSALLVMAQPRALSPQENVALDSWVRGGGRVLLFVDPMLTADSAFALGDRRRPEDMAMLSPILKRWGMVLRFDADQSPGERTVRLMGQPAPVNLPGQLAILPGASGCTVQDDGLAAQCAIGAGKSLVIADAAVLEDGGAAVIAARRPALEAVLQAIRR